MKKKRFGVSIPENIAVRLDTVAKALGVDRSYIVAQALEAYLNDYEHYLEEHRCLGLILVVTEGRRRINVASIVERYRDVVCSYSHVHTDGRCIELLLVSGSSSRIASLYRELMDIDGVVRYIPLHSLTK